MRRRRRSRRRRFTKVFTRTSHLYLPYARWVKSTSCHHISLTSILMLLFHLCQCLQKVCFLRFPAITSHTFNLSPMHSTCPINLIFFDWIPNIIFDNEDLHYATCSSYFHLGPNIISTLWSNIPGLCSSLYVRHLVSRLYKTTGEIIVTYLEYLCS